MTLEQINALTEHPSLYPSLEEYKAQLVEAYEYSLIAVPAEPILVLGEGKLAEETLEEYEARLATANAEITAAIRAELMAMLDARVASDILAIAQEKINAKVAVQQGRINAHFAADGGIPWRTGIFDDSNPLKEMNDLLGSEELDAKLDLLDAAKDTFLAALAIKAVKDQKKAAGALIKKRCDDAYDYVTGYNFLGGKTSEEIDQMEIDFTDIQKALKAGRPDKAAGLIQAITDPAYAELKTELLVILSGG